MHFVHQPAVDSRLGDFLKTNLAGSWTDFRAAIAFVKRSGTKHIRTALSEFGKKNSIEVLVGIDHGGTSQEGLEDLLSAVKPPNRLIVFHNESFLTFHPKIYLFKSKNAAEVLIGSGNLTEGGLFTNYEASIRLELDLKNEAERSLLKSVEDVLDKWADPTAGTAKPLDAQFLAQLGAHGYVPIEALTAPKPTGSAQTKTNGGQQPLFSSHMEPKAPAAPGGSGQSAGGGQGAQPATGASGTPAAAPVSQPAAPSTTGFVMTLQRTDVGVGQTTSGAQRRSPEIFLPVLAVRDDQPGFWGWPNSFVADPGWAGPIDQFGYGKMDRAGVRLRLGGDDLTATIWYNPDKRDFRIRSEAIRSAGNIGDILRMEIPDLGSPFDYYVEIVPQGTTMFPIYQSRCTEKVRPPSQKTYGYY